MNIESKTEEILDKSVWATIGYILVTSIVIVIYFSIYALRFFFVFMRGISMFCVGMALGIIPAISSTSKASRRTHHHY